MGRDDLSRHQMIKRTMRIQQISEELEEYRKNPEEFDKNHPRVQSGGACPGVRVLTADDDLEW